MKIAVYVKTSLNDSTSKINLCTALSAEPGFEVFEVSDVSENLSANKLLVFGGDGTMLYAAKHSPVPVVGVNLGNTGFLAELESNVKPDKLISVMRSDKVLERFMLTAQTVEGVYLALNEVTLKSTNARPIRINLFIDGEFVDAYHSDGIIVSTPTGSTAYSLSAGGPVLAPSLPAIVINPVCPHSLHSRPLVVDSTSEIKLELDCGSKANVIIDGEISAILPENGVIIVSKSTKTAKFVVADGKNFYKKLLEKMNRWGITR